MMMLRGQGGYEEPQALTSLLESYAPELIGLQQSPGVSQIYVPSFQVQGPESQPTLMEVVQALARMRLPRDTVETPEHPLGADARWDGGPRASGVGEEDPGPQGRQTPATQGALAQEVR